MKNYAVFCKRDDFNSIVEKWLAEDICRNQSPKISYYPTDAMYVINRHEILFIWVDNNNIERLRAYNLNGIWIQEPINAESEMRFVLPSSIAAISSKKFVDAGPIKFLPPVR